MDARTILYRLRMGEVLSRDEITWFANGLASGDVSDAQAGAFAMGVCQRGLGEEGRVALTQAMRDSGDRLVWDLPAPVVDKHSTGGLGDTVSLLLAPILAEAGVYCPMISGRGLGHTGGTLDKLEAIPGFTVDQDEAAFRAIVADVGCAIVSASGDLAPADKRLYAVRDVTGTVESVDLITASILSKKLAAGLEALVLDVKAGSGAFMGTIEEARVLAKSLVQTANGAGCRTSALMTDMWQPLATAVGNAVEVRAVMAALTGGEARMAELTAALCGEVLALSGAVESADAGTGVSRAILEDGRAAERFGRMVAAQGGPADFVEAWDAHLPKAPVTRVVEAKETGFVTEIDGRSLGLAVVAMGGGRMRGGDQVDPRVGLTDVAALGTAVEADMPIAVIHAVDDAMADATEKSLRDAVTIAAEAVAQRSLILERIAP